MPRDPAAVEPQWRGAFLENLSLQLGDLAKELQGLEKVLTSAQNTSADVSDAAIRRLQRFDFLKQSLDDLALLTRLVGQAETDGALNPHQIAQIALKLDMQTTRDILQSAFTGQTRPVPQPIAGFVDLF